MDFTNYDLRSSIMADTKLEYKNKIYYFPGAIFIQNDQEYFVNVIHMHNELNDKSELIIKIPDNPTLTHDIINIYLNAVYSGTLVMDYNASVEYILDICDFARCVCSILVEQLCYNKLFTRNVDDNSMRKIIGYGFNNATIMIFINWLNITNIGNDIFKIIKKHEYILILEYIDSYVYDKYKYKYILSKNIKSHTELLHYAYKLNGDIIFNYIKLFHLNKVDIVTYCNTHANGLGQYLLMDSIVRFDAYGIYLKNSLSCSNLLLIKSDTKIINK
uniref:Uncharacterized protein n=1 Tax=Pithovirus LCPAC101 TaxID=2506586 RepID=A0A481Z2T0_9VIRU|nr:MAG: hypothetical protein LCPAC101_00170 [Pithovirus LCPAC101]